MGSGTVMMLDYSGYGCCYYWSISHRIPMQASHGYHAYSVCKGGCISFVHKMGWYNECNVTWLGFVETNQSLHWEFLADWFLVAGCILSIQDDGREHVARVWKGYELCLGEGGGYAAITLCNKPQCLDNNTTVWVCIWLPSVKCILGMQPRARVCCNRYYISVQSRTTE